MVATTNVALLLCIFVCLARAGLAAGYAGKQNLGGLLTSRRVSRAGGGAHVHVPELAGAKVNASTGNPMMLGNVRKYGEQFQEGIQWPKGEAKSVLTCGNTFGTYSNSDKHARCPDECPFIVQDRTDSDFCTFQCVQAVECKLLNPRTPIGDEELRVCRAPMVQGCKEYTMDGRDACHKCHPGYYLNKDGTCQYQFLLALCGLALIGAFLVVVLGFWAVDMMRRPVTNQEGLNTGRTFRSRAKLHQPKDADGDRKLYPLSTNLLRHDVAGPGLLLHFNFQFMVIVWALLVAFAWMFFGWFVDSDLFIIGTRKFGTPRENCILVKWGFERQQDLMWTKISFLVIVYLLSFGLALFHSWRQQQIFETFDYENKTMKDFVALLHGLPNIPGSSKAEEELKKIVEEATFTKVVGVSVAWDYNMHQDDIDALVEDELERLELESSLKLSPREKQEAGIPEEEEERQEEPAPAEPPKYRATLEKVETALLEVSGLANHLSSEEQKKDVLSELTSSSDAFVVFETQAMRDAAVEKLAESGIDVQGTRCKLLAIEAEPNTVLWENFHHNTTWMKVKKIFKGFGAILLALLTWTLVFYLPYAWSIFNFNYDNGQEPGVVYSIAFTIVVVIGNAIMYEVCARIAASIGYRFADDMAVTYMILYLIACLFNVLLDLCTTYYMARMIMMNLGFRTYDGIALQDVPTFTEMFESYAMQRTLAENAFRYAWPSTYFVPFLLEPFITIYLPRKLGEIIVRTHSHIKGQAAEDWLAAPPLELGRYADILLNILLGIIIFYFPGGFTHWLFLGMVLAHAYIYMFDHVRVLRVVPSCCFATMGVDWWSQVMLAPCCATILSSLVFKMNCQHYGFCLDGIYLIAACTGAWVFHFVIHVWILVKLIPKLRKKEPPPDMENDMTYQELNRKVACSWFSSNPVHCLRSKYIYKHGKPCIFCRVGKEHLLEVNEAIGCCFEDFPAEVEEMDDGKSLATLWRSVSKNFAGAKP